MLDRFERLLASPQVAAALRRFEPQLDFARARLSRSSEVGLRLTLSVLLFLGATWLFAGVAEDVVTGDPLVAFDHLIAQWIERHSAADVTRWMSLITHAHDVLPISAFGLAFAICLAWRRYWYWLLTLLLVLPEGMLLNLLLKQIFQRERPLPDEPLIALATYSFPSGHVTGATLLYGVLAAILAAHAPALGTRVTLYAMACFMVLLVAVTRLYLGRTEPCLLLTSFTPWPSEANRFDVTLIPSLLSRQSPRGCQCAGSGGGRDQRSAAQGPCLEARAGGNDHRHDQQCSDFGAGSAKVRSDRDARADGAGGSRRRPSGTATSRAASSGKERAHLASQGGA